MWYVKYECLSLGGTTKTVIKLLWSARQLHLRVYDLLNAVINTYGSQDSNKLRQINKTADSYCIAPNSSIIRLLI